MTSGPKNAGTLTLNAHDWFSYRKEQLQATERISRLSSPPCLNVDSRRLNNASCLQLVMRCDWPSTRPGRNGRAPWATPSAGVEPSASSTWSDQCCAVLAGCRRRRTRPGAAHRTDRERAGCCAREASMPPRPGTGPEPEIQAETCLVFPTTDWAIALSAGAGIPAVLPGMVH